MACDWLKADVIINEIHGEWLWCMNVRICGKFRMILHAWLGTGILYPFVTRWCYITGAFECLAVNVRKIVQQDKKYEPKMYQNIRLVEKENY